MVVTYETFAHLSVFGGISLSASDNTAQMVVCVCVFYWLFGNLLLLHKDIDVILFPPEQNRSETFISGEKFLFLYSCAYVPPQPPLGKCWLHPSEELDYNDYYEASFFWGCSYCWR